MMVDLVILLCKPTEMMKSHYSSHKLIQNSHKLQNIVSSTLNLRKLLQLKVKPTFELVMTSLVSAKWWIYHLYNSLENPVHFTKTWHMKIMLRTLHTK